MSSNTEGFHRRASLHRCLGDLLQGVVRGLRSALRPAARTVEAGAWNIRPLHNCCTGRSDTYCSMSGCITASYSRTSPWTKRPLHCTRLFLKTHSPRSCRRPSVPTSRHAAPRHRQESSGECSTVRPRRDLYGTCETSCRSCSDGSRTAGQLDGRDPRLVGKNDLDI